MTLTALLFTIAAASPVDLDAWAARSGYTLTAVACTPHETKHLGGEGAKCWSAKALKPQRGSKDLFPRMRFVVTELESESRATERAKQLRETPEALQGADGKAWPLRAAFKARTHVVAVTTDAFAFEAEVHAAAVALATGAGGTELSCGGHDCAAR